MIRMIPIDASRLDLTATGTVSPVPVFVEMPDGSRRPDPNGTQGTDPESGVLLWTVDVLCYETTRDGENSEVLGIQVAVAHKPVVGRLAPIAFHALTLRNSLNKKTGVQRQYWSAESIADAHQRGQTKPKDAEQQAA